MDTDEGESFERGRDFGRPEERTQPPDECLLACCEQAVDSTQENGSKHSTPVASKSVTFRVATVRPWTHAVAAMKPSRTGMGLGDVETTPAVGNGLVDGKDASAVLVDQGGEPCVKTASGRFVAAVSNTFDALSDLGDRHHAQKDLWGSQFRKPTHDLGLGAPAATQLRDDVGVDEESQSSTARPRSRSRSKSSSRPTLGMASR